MKKKRLVNGVAFGSYVSPAIKAVNSRARRALCSSPFIITGDNEDYDDDESTLEREEGQW